MEIQITTRKIRAPRELRTFINGCVATAMERFVAFITVAHVEISDRNGRRGGGDKRCRLRLVLTDGSFVRAEEVEANPRRAIVRAVARLQTAIRNHLRAV